MFFLVGLLLVSTVSASQKNTLPSYLEAIPGCTAENHDGYFFWAGYNAQWDRVDDVIGITKPESLKPQNKNNLALARVEVYSHLRNINFIRGHLDDVINQKKIAAGVKKAESLRRNGDQSVVFVYLPTDTKLNDVIRV